MNDAATDPTRFADMNDDPTPDGSEDGTFDIGEASVADRIVLPEQAAIIFAIREDVEAEEGVTMVDVKVVFSDGTAPDVVPMVSNIAARAATVVAAMLRGELDVTLPTDATAFDPAST